MMYRLSFPLVVVVLSLGCVSTRPVTTTRSPASTYGVTVNHFANQTTIRHPKITVDANNIQFTKGKPLKEWFEIEHSATCKDGSTGPQSIVMTLMHETPSKGGWHFPRQKFESFTEPNAGFAVTIKLSSGDVLLDKAMQLDLRKDLASDATFYESFIVDIKSDALKKVTEAAGDISYELPGARLVLTKDQAATIRAFANSTIHCGRDK